jgi:hypothetical protein
VRRILPQIKVIKLKKHKLIIFIIKVMKLETLPAGQQETASILDREHLLMNTVLLEEI